MHRGKFKSSKPGRNSTHYTCKPVIWPKQQAFAGTYSNMPSNTGTFTIHDFSVPDFGED